MLVQPDASCILANEEKDDHDEDQLMHRNRRTSHLVGATLILLIGLAFSAYALAIDRLDMIGIGLTISIAGVLYLLAIKGLVWLKRRARRRR